MNTQFASLWKRNLVLAGLLLLASGFCGLSSNTAADDKEMERRRWGKKVFGVQCSIDSRGEDTIFQADQPIYVVCRMRNSGNKSVRLMGAPPLRVLDFKILDAEEKPVPPTLYFRQHRAAALEASKLLYELAPGKKTKTTTLQLDRLYDMTRSGKYKVSFSRGILLPDDSSKVVTSKVLEITVKDPK